MLALLALLFAQPAAANPDYDAGVEALKAKDTAAAAAAFTRCLASEPDNADCHWELGWALWVKSDWKGVVSQWDVVAKLDPTRKGLNDYLSQARDNLGLNALLAAGRAAAPATYASTAPKGATLRLRAVGDCMLGSVGGLPPDDGKDSFTAVADWLSDADLTFGNLEGPLCDTGESSKCADSQPGACYAFRSPTRYGALYKAAGFDVMSTANNHAGDFGQICRQETESTLDSLGIAHSGRPGDIARLEKNGLKIALIGFHTSQATHNVNDHETAAALVRALAAENDLVIVSFHGGAEGSKASRVPRGPETFYGENRGDLRAFTHTVVDAGADLVLGHGPHVLRGMELYKGRLIAYSLGNFATYGQFNLSGNLGVGAVLEVSLAADGQFIGGKALPTKQVGEGRVEKDPENTAIDLLRTLSEQDFPGTAIRVAQDGSLAAPLDGGGARP